MDSELADEWYAPLGGELSQGDIVRDIPFGLIDAPLTVCQPNNTDPAGKSKYWPFSQLPKRRSVEFLHAKFGPELGLGIVVWPDCQIDKRKNQRRPEKEWFAAVAPVVPLEKLASSLHDKVKSFDRPQWFPLPAREPEPAQDSYVDLRHIWPVRYSLLADRVIALSETAKRAFKEQRFWFDTEVRLQPEVECPHCHKSVDSALFFQNRENN